MRAAAPIRWGYRVAEIVALTGLPRSTVDRLTADLPRRRFGSAVVLEARAVEALFKFGTDEAAPSPEALAAVAELLA